MPLPITLCILIASGFERAETPAVQSERLDLLLRSIKRDPTTTVRIRVFDDFSQNKKAQQDCSNICAKYAVDYLVCDEWRGPCHNYNFAVANCDTEFIAMLGDDQVCTPGWWHYMEHFITHNPNLQWGMLGWSVIFAEDLVNTHFFAHKSEFYTKPDLTLGFTINNLPREAVAKNWCNWDRPRFRGACSGTAFVIRKSLWYRFGGFYEGIFQFDEDYGDNVWNLTDYTCIQVPTPPVLHYGGACGWDSSKGPADQKWRDGWKTRPFVPVDFDLRGQTAAAIIDRTPDNLATLDYMRIPAANQVANLILDLGCGKNIRNEGAIGIDIVGRPITDADVICNLGFEPLPFLSDSCKKVVAHDILEHIPHVVWVTDRGIVKRSTPTIYLFNEVYRVLAHGGDFEIAVPFYPNGEAFQDPTHASVWTPDTTNYFCNTYGGFKEAYGHKSNFILIKQFTDGAHLHIHLQAQK